MSVSTDEALGSAQVAASVTSSTPRVFVEQRSRSGLLAPLLFGTLALTVACLVIGYELEPQSPGNAAQPFHWTGLQRDLAHAAFIALATLGLVAYGAMRRYPGFWHALVQRCVTIALALLTLLAGLTYFYGAHGSKENYSHLHDSFHYLLGAKYYDEVGYDRFYVCVAQVLNRHQLPDRIEARDLSTDQTTTVGRLREMASCRESFSPERWTEFASDVALFYEREPHTIRGALHDRGYNGSPLQTFLASTVANSFPLSYAALSAATLLDVVALCAALTFLGIAFGSRVGLLCALLFFSEFVDRHMIIGNSFLRYQWLSALFVCLAALKLRRYALAGAAMAVSASLAVFPVLFCGAVVARTVQALARTREVPRNYRRFFGGAIAAGVVCLALGAGHGEGVQNYPRFFDAMQVHNAIGRAPGFGVGLKYNFAFRGEFDRPTYSKAKKMQELKAMRPVIVTVAAMLLTWVVALALRLDDVEGAVLLGFTGLFCVFGPTGYYFAFTAVLVLLWHRRAREPGGWGLLVLLFALSILPLVAIVREKHHFFVFNTVVSSTYTIYLLAALTYLSMHTNLMSDLAHWLFAPASRTLPDPAIEGHLDTK